MLSVAIPLFIWWLIVEILGLVALPLAFRLFRALPDRGYALSKPLGILLCSYLFWILVTFGFLANKREAIVFVILLAAAISWYLHSERKGEEILAFLYRHRKVVLASELLFTAAFGLWALVRAYNPEIMGTEKPMEFAFLNAILRSERFPPHDPWLSGYGISYYYFGYLMMALLTRLSGLPSEVTFNLGIALLFALTLTGAASLVYNLVSGEKEEGSALTFGFLGALLVTVIGNLEGFLEVLYTRGIGSASLWKWVDIRNLTAAPVSGQWLPTDHWWWWRASRVVHDVMLGRDMEVIDEFPFFSFLLGDMHPHVLALPFVLLALALALSLFRARERLDWAEVGLLGLLVGALGFLNSWDLPTYGLIVVAAYGIGRYIQGHFTLSGILEFAGKLVIFSLLLYLPFYLGFRSQAGGILPVLFVKTRWHHYLVMFGLFVFVLFSFLIAQFSELVISKIGVTVRETLTRGLSLFLALLLLPFSLLIFALSIVSINEGTRTFVIEKLKEAATLFPDMPPILVDSNPWPMLRVALLDPLFSQPWLTIFLAILLCLTLFSLWWRMRAKLTSTDPSSLFILVLVATGFLLTYLCEYVYIRDIFGTRMNTIFKLYYQAWVLLAIASAYGVYYLSRKLRGVSHYLWTTGFLILFALSLIYPLAATRSKTAGASPTLDGMAYLTASSPDDYEAIQWLRVNVEGSPVILEAPGGSYTLFGRVSAHTGLPTLLGWGGHELQWRGTYEEPSRREPDIETLYTNLDLEETERLLQEYDIEYVYLGPLEVSRYNLDRAMVEKWATIMDLVYQQGGVTIYRRR
jgi:YYY domain-containing protein